MNRSSRDLGVPSNDGKAGSVARDASPGFGPSAEPGIRCIDSRELLGPRQQLLIRHEGRLYRLRITRQNKLLLGV